MERSYKRKKIAIMLLLVEILLFISFVGYAFIGMQSCAMNFGDWVPRFIYMINTITDIKDGMSFDSFK